MFEKMKDEWRLMTKIEKNIGMTAIAMGIVGLLILIVSVMGASADYAKAGACINDLVTAGVERADIIVDGPNCWKKGEY